jgi:hypothetical protein
MEDSKPEQHQYFERDTYYLHGYSDERDNKPVQQRER